MTILQAFLNRPARLAVLGGYLCKGFHCLSTWDGPHRKPVARLKATLNDPSSFEHAETLVGPVDDEGVHALAMKFRASNAYGALILTEAHGLFRHCDCEVIDLIHD